MLNELFRRTEIGTASRESGGLKKSLSVTSLITLGVGAIVGMGIFVLTGKEAAIHAGPALTISFAISAMGCILTAFCYAEFAAMIPLSGSVYSYSYATMGELIAWFIGWDLILEYLFACSTVAVGWSGYVVSLFNGWGIDIPKTLSESTFIYTSEGWGFSGSIINFPAVFIVAVVATLLVGGIKQSAMINNIIVVIKVVVILLFIGFGLSYVNVDNWTPYIPENTGEFGSFGLSGILRAAAVVFFAYLGFDALATAAQEVKNPQKDMPKGIIASLVICASLYVLVTAVLTGIVDYRQLDTPAPIAYAVDYVGKGLSWLSPFIKLGAVAGLSSVILVMMLGQTRIYYAISRDGLLPQFFSKLHDKYKTPHKSTIFAGIATGLIAGLFPYGVLSELVSIGTLMAFTIVCISVIILRKKMPHLHRPFKTPLVPYLPLLGALVCLLQMVSLPWNTWVRLIAWMIVGMIFYFIYGIRRSKLRKK
ncbi:MAG: amino acid permease [Prevotellaceae bacterium]|jgi:APA family basic amino acid/polyamine antiporter|nr:amino acid permease [Prevotellaceae bacterium]